MLYQLAIAGAVLGDLGRDKTLSQEPALVDLGAEHVHRDREMDWAGSPRHRRSGRLFAFLGETVYNPAHSDGASVKSEFADRWHGPNKLNRFASILSREVEGPAL